MKYFTPLTICTFIEFFLNLFVDISLVFPHRSFSVFQTTKSFVLFEVTLY